MSDLGDVIDRLEHGIDSYRATKRRRLNRHPHREADGAPSVEPDYQTPLDSEDDILDERGHPSIAPDPAGSGDVFRVFYPEGEFRGNNQRWRLREYVGHRPENAHVRFYMYFPSGFTFHDHPSAGGSKHGGFAAQQNGCGAGGSKCTGEGFSARMCTANPGARHDETGGDPIPLFYQVYDSTATEEGLEWGWHDSWEIGGPELGSWFRVDHYCELNDPGVANGVLKGWVDGELAFERDDYLFRDSEHADLGINSFRMHNYFGGGWGSPRDQSVYWKDLAIWVDRGPQL